jgi:hypothetical protein
VSSRFSRQRVADFFVATERNSAKVVLYFVRGYAASSIDEEKATAEGGCATQESLDQHPA